RRMRSYRIERCSCSSSIAPFATVHSERQPAPHPDRPASRFALRGAQRQRPYVAAPYSRPSPLHWLLLMNAADQLDLTRRSYLAKAPNAQVHRAGAAALVEPRAPVCAGSGATASWAAAAVALPNAHLS